MKNKFLFLTICIFIKLIISTNLNAKEIFKFNVSEIEITQNGNIFKGYNGGEAFTNDGISIKANNFEYNKILTSLISNGNVQLKDAKKDITINAEKITYLKNREIIIAEGKVELKDSQKNITINSNKISYFKKKEKIIANNKVVFRDLQMDTLIKADEISYFIKQEKIIANNQVKLIDNKKNISINTNKITFLKKIKKIFTEGKTKAWVGSKYEFESSNVIFFKDTMEIFSNYKTVIRDDKFSLYKLSSFNFQIDEELLKGTDIFITQNTNATIGASDQLFFENAFFDLKNKNYKSAKTKINLKKSLFDRSENDPRIYGASSTKKNDIVSVKKATFTSCKKTDKCPPWRLEASEIKHDKKKKQIIYENTILKVYDIPVFYFPKFFHPDPTVKRQSGFLQPTLNSSNILGSSLSVPYFYAISDNKDLTFNPIVFSKNVKMFQNEFRQKNQNSSLIADLGITNGFKSSATHKKKNINHLFAKIDKDLRWGNFTQSDLSIFIQRVSKDTYLKIFGDNLPENSIKPMSPDNLNSGFNFFLEQDNFLLSGGADVFEDLTKKKSDRYQFVLPYYNFSKLLEPTNYGSFNLNSKGNNTIDNTNNLKSRIINDLSFKMNDKIFEKSGIKNNFNIYFKNLNSVGKNVNTYKSSPQIELQSLMELNSELPLIKKSNEYGEMLVPRLSLKLNPGDMKNHSTTERKINMDNIFNINRLGIDDSFEAGNSLTFGFEYKKEKINKNENYLELKLASVLRDKKENNIPLQTSLNNKHSNLFGSLDYGMSKFINLDYNFAIDNNIENFEYNSIGLGLSLNNFVTKFNFIEDNSSAENTNIFENTSKYNINKSNSVSFKTRRNREISLTEYYNLVYEYQNDCLTAGIKFNKVYYEDRDLKPSENLMFTISFFPLATINQSMR